MDDLSTRNLVLVHLLDADGPGPRTTAGICEAFDVGTSVSRRVEVLSALSSLQDSGHLVADEGVDRDRTVYSLTDRGGAVAGELRDDLADRTVEIVRGEHVQSCSLSAARDEIGAPSIAGVLCALRGGRIRTDDIPETTFVGREAELSSIQSALDAVEDGSSGTVTVVGERGVGKTELLRRVTDRADEMDATTVSIACRSDPNEPFEPLREALAAHGNADVFERPAGGLDSAGGLVARRAELFGDLVEAIDSIGGAGPVVVTVDDLHDAGDAILEFLDFFADRLPDGTLLLAATRPVELDAWDVRPTVKLSEIGSIDVDIELGPLDRECTRELVVRLLGDRSVPASLTDRLYERTGGTPLFVIGVITRLQEAGTIDPEAGVYPDEHADLPIPEDASRAVEVRLQALDDPARSILEDAAILGHTVDTEVLKSVVDLPPPVVQEYLELLVDADVLDENGTIQFLSEVTREVVLEALDGAYRRRRHRRIARTYERLFQEPPHAAVARHYERGGLSRPALTHYCAAGDQAIDVFAHEEALEYYERALALARSTASTGALAEVLESIGRVHFLAGEYDEADRYFEYLRDRTDDPERIQRSYRYQAETASERGDLDTADEYAQAGIEAVEEPNRTTCRLIGHRGWYRLQRGNLDEAEEYFRRQHDLAQELDDEDRLGGAYHNLGMIAHQRGNVEESIDLLERAAEANERSSSTRDALASYNNLSIVYRNAGRIDDAIDALRTVRNRAAEIGDRPTETLAIGNLTRYYHLHGDLDRAEEAAQEAIDASRTIGLPKKEATALHSSADVRIDRCQFDAARERLEASIELHEATGNARLTARTHAMFARLALFEADRERARRHVETALDVCEGVEPNIRSHAQLRLGDVRLDEGDLDGAIEAYERALEYVDAGGSVQTSALVKLRLGAARSEATDGATGVATARDAVEEATELDAPIVQARANLGLARSLRYAGDYEEAADALAAAERAIDGLDVPLYEAWIRLERALVAVDRGEPDGAERIEDAARFAQRHGVTKFARECRAVLTG